jgi:hypothetical protein
MERVLQPPLFDPSPLGDPFRWVVLDLRAQLSVDPWAGWVELTRYSDCGALERVFGSEMVLGDAVRPCLAALRHFAGQLALVTGWPDLQARSISAS